MPAPSESASRPNNLLRLPSTRALVMTALVGSGLLYLFFAAPAAPVRPFDPRCEPWDDAASAAIARLVTTRSETAEAFFGDAVFRLRRARRNCRAGWVGLARLDYEALAEDRIGPRYAINNRRHIGLDVPVSP